MHAGLLIGDHPRTDLRQCVDDAVDGLFVSGNQRRRQDDQVFVGDRNAAVFPARHPRQRRQWLTLGSGGDEHQPFGCHHLGCANIDDVLVGDVEEAEFLGNAHIANHGAADERDSPSQSHSGVDDLLDPVDVGREARHDHPPSVGAPDEPVQRRADLTLRRPDAGDLGVGGVAEEEVDAGVAESRHPGQVGGSAVGGKLVEFDVAGVQHRSGAGVDRDRQRVGNRMVDREVLALEDPVRTALSLSHFDELRLDAVLPAFRGD